MSNQNRRNILEVMPCDRKTVGRNIQIIIDCGYPIAKTRKGVYMDFRVFTIE